MCYVCKLHIAREKVITFLPCDSCNLAYKDVTTMQNHTSNTEFNSTSLINPVLIENELRILDTELAQRLGFSNPLDIRKLIRRHEESLKQMGVFATVAKTRNPAGGRPSNEFYLNRKQAIFITAKSETSEATDITIEIIERFDAYERGEQPQFAIPKSYAEALRLAADQAEQLKELKPKAEALERIALSEGSFCLTDAAKSLQTKPKKLIDFLSSNHWIYRRVGNKNWIAYQDKIQMGYLEHKVTEIFQNDGTSKIREQVKITPKGITKLSKLFSSDMEAA